MSQRIVIADNYPVFRAGMARFLAVEEDFRIIGQCDDLPRLYKAIEVSHGAVVIVASSMQPSLAELMERARESKVRFVAVLDKFDHAQPYLRFNIPGILYRDVSQVEMVKCLRTVARGGSYVQKPTHGEAAHLDADSVGEMVRSRLSRKELQIVELIVQGYKNKDIASELNNSEQVIKNYLRSIFDKTGVSDRLELALFTLHHRVLVNSVAGPGERMPPGAAA